METIKTIFEWAGYPSTLITIVVALAGVYLWIRGILPVLKALGTGLAGRKIAILAKGGNVSGVRQTLLQSKLFRAKNISEIERLEDIEGAKKASILVVYWPDWMNDITKVLEIKEDTVPLIIYCPPNADRIPQEVMVEIDNKRNSVVSNFRGRLLNDIVTAMITTSYEK